MFARVSTYTGADADRLLKGFEGVSEPLTQMDGFSHAHFLVDRSSGKAMSITIWRDEQSLLAGVEKANELRKQGSEAGGASIASVEHFEIGLTVRTPSEGAAR